MGIIVLFFIIGFAVVYFIHKDESCPRFKSEKEIAKCLNLTDEQFQKVKKLDGNFVNYYGDTWLEELYRMNGKSGIFYGYKNCFIDRAKRIGKRYSDKGIIILGVSAFVVILIVWIFGLYSKVDYNPETETHYLYYFWGHKPIADGDWHLCELYSFVCSLVSWISYIGFVSYVVSLFLSMDNGELAEKIGYVIGMSVMMVGFTIDLVFLRYILFSSREYYSFLFQYRIRDYFGLFNLWQAIIALVLISAVFVSHRYAAKGRYMSNVCEKIEEFYERENSMK